MLRSDRTAAGVLVTRFAFPKGSPSGQSERQHGVGRNHGDVLRAIQPVRERARSDPGFPRVSEQWSATLRVQTVERACIAALKHDVSGGHKVSGAPDVGTRWMLSLPDQLAC